MACHSDSRIRHGMYMNLLILQLLAIVAISVFLIAGVVYLVCLFLPYSTAYWDAIAVNFLDFVFCLAFAFVSGTVLVVLVETLLFLVRPRNPDNR